MSRVCHRPGKKYETEAVAEGMGRRQRLCVFLLPSTNRATPKSLVASLRSYVLITQTNGHFDPNELDAARQASTM